MEDIMLNVGGIVLMLETTYFAEKKSVETGYTRNRFDTGNTQCLRYPNIDMQKTGRRIQNIIKKAGYSVREIQEYLGLSCPQSIYRWFKGQILPSINHMYALSILLHVHMEELLVMKCESLAEWIPADVWEDQWKRIVCYRDLLHGLKSTF